MSTKPNKYSSEKKQKERKSLCELKNCILITIIISKIIKNENEISKTSQKKNKDIYKEMDSINMLFPNFQM